MSTNLRKLLLEHSAIVLDAGKEYLAESRLTPLLYQEGLPSVDELFKQLRSATFSGLHRKVVDAMTNNETWFFRDFVPYEALRTRVIPELLAARATERKLMIWSAACSSGQEPYSLAMLLRESFPMLTSWNVTLLASDISTAILSRAQKGRYSQLEVNRGMPAALLGKYFTREGLDWELKPEIRRLVQFRQLNLASAWADMPPCDLVMLRNVLIYFEVPTKKEILERLRRVMRPDGYLFLGTAETTLNLDDQLERVPFEKTAYYKRKV
ncbi:MAG TPA: protein-glutamate O-methyltransferase CheR [Terriglobales bacterium]|nr:protein-glutamate O-methyltransferase CheR [Terriglobales bacterium]